MLCNSSDDLKWLFQPLSCLCTFCRLSKPIPMGELARPNNMARNVNTREHTHLVNTVAAAVHHSSIEFVLMLLWRLQQVTTTTATTTTITPSCTETLVAHTIEPASLVELVAWALGQLDKLLAYETRTWIKLNSRHSFQPKMAQISSSLSQASPASLNNNDNVCNGRHQRNFLAAKLLSRVLTKRARSRADQCVPMCITAFQCVSMRFNTFQCVSMRFNALYCKALPCKAMRPAACVCSFVVCAFERLAMLFAMFADGNNHDNDNSNDNRTRTRTHNAKTYSNFDATNVPERFWM